MWQLCYSPVVMKLVSNVSKHNCNNAQAPDTSKKQQKKRKKEKKRSFIIVSSL